MVVDSGAADIVYSNRFTGVHGNYLRGSILAAGIDPDNLAPSDPAVLNFGTGADAVAHNGDAKAWRDIWGAGHGVGAVRSVVTTAALVERLESEYTDARAALLRA
jgi:nitronate monooxygenase